MLDHWNISYQKNLKSYPEVFQQEDCMMGRQIRCPSQTKMAAVQIVCSLLLLVYYITPAIFSSLIGQLYILQTPWIRPLRKNVKIISAWFIMIKRNIFNSLFPNNQSLLFDENLNIFMNGILDLLLPIFMSHLYTQFSERIWYYYSCCKTSLYLNSCKEYPNISNFKQTFPDN